MKKIFGLIVIMLLFIAPVSFATAGVEITKSESFVCGLSEVIVVANFDSVVGTRNSLDQCRQGNKKGQNSQNSKEEINEIFKQNTDNKKKGAHKSLLFLVGRDNIELSLFYI